MLSGAALATLAVAAAVTPLRDARACGGTFCDAGPTAMPEPASSTMAATSPGVLVMTGNPAAM